MDMKKIIRLFQYTVILALFSTCESSHSFTEIDRLFEKFSGNSPGAALGIIHNGEWVYKKGFGLANFEGSKPVTPTTNFRLASVTKQFTATAILLLKERGLIDLDWSLTEVFDNFPAYGEKITLRHLLQHTSGIPDYEDYVLDTALTNQIMDAGVLEISKQLSEGYFRPGENYRYSNTAYALLSLVVENYSGQDFPTFLQENIFRPLGMDNTVAYIRNINTVPERAFGYDLTAGRWVERDQSSTSAVLGDGGIYSNLEDLFKWDQSLYTTQILSQESLDDMFAYGALNSGKTFNYGYGWHLKETEDGESVVYHTGSTISFRNVFYRIPSRKLSVIVLTNRNQVPEEGMTLWAEQIIKRLGDKI